MNTDLPEQSNTERSASADEIASVLESLARAEKRIQLWTYVRGTLMVLVCLAPFLLHGNTGGVVFLLALVCGMPLCGTALSLLREQSDWCLRHLPKINDVRYLGTLLEAMPTDTSGLPKEFQPYMLRLLPQLQASHAPLLSASHRRKLHAMLLLSNRRWNAAERREVSLAVLKALEQVGDREAIPPVAQVAKTSKDPQVREAAEQCLVFLHQWGEQRSVSSTLLRASDANTAALETLLRATVARPDEQPQILLRANAAPDERNA